MKKLQKKKKVEYPFKTDLLLTWKFAEAPGPRPLIKNHCPKR